MTIQEIYKLAIEKGIIADFRGKEAIQEYIDDKKEEFNKRVEFFQKPVAAWCRGAFAAEKENGHAQIRRSSGQPAGQLQAHRWADRAVTRRIAARLVVHGDRQYHLRLCLSWKRGDDQTARNEKANSLDWHRIPPWGVARPAEWPTG